ncbi:MAG TPA: hypothetical protein VLW86_05005 [Syntrophorhabdales bacterium]|nr:hypothetical protein [Syntrophorhabdales bacterium]
MFKTRAVVIDFLGDKERYPCHHGYHIGDEFIWDGESFLGKICPSLATLVVPKLIEMHAAGPRYRGPLYYYPFLYAPKSVEDPELKKYDGLGFRNVFESYGEPKYSMANLASSSAFTWPPPEERVALKEVTMICPDYRTSVLVKLEAFDLSDKGRNIPYFRREMVILHKVLGKPGIRVDEVLGEFSAKEIEGIYPALSPIMVRVLVEELDLMGFLEIHEGKAVTTTRGEAKLDEFKKGLSKEERDALGM